MEFDQLPASVRQRIHVELTEGRQQIDVRWKINWIVCLLCFGIPAGLLYMVLTQSPGGLFASIAILISLPLCWIGVSNLLNTTTIVKQDGSISVRHHPVFRRGAIIDKVRRVRVVEREHHGSEGITMISFRAYVNTSDGHTKDLRIHHLEEAVLRWLEGKLNRS